MTLRDTTQHGTAHYKADGTADGKAHGADPEPRSTAQHTTAQRRTTPQHHGSGTADHGMGTVRARHGHGTPRRHGPGTTQPRRGTGTARHTTAPRRTKPRHHRTAHMARRHGTGAAWARHGKPRRTTPRHHGVGTARARTHYTGTARALHGLAIAMEFLNVA